MSSSWPMSEHAWPPHPFADLIGLRFDDAPDGKSRCRVLIRPELLNPHGVVHGAVAYALADTGMGGALYPMLESEIFESDKLVAKALGTYSIHSV
jgi:acyl-coenzyme A thioesterase PaaI-like protein